MSQAFLETLNKQQRKALELKGGDGCVLGSPGAGKTRTMIGFIVSCVADGLSPSSILATTFTKAAAQEIGERLASLGVTGVNVSTLHSFAFKCLNRSGKMQGERIATMGQVQFLAKQIIQAWRKAKKIHRKVDLGLALGACSLIKAQGTGWLPDDRFGRNDAEMATFRKACARACRETGLSLNMGQFEQFYQELERRKSAEGLFDFDDMQLWGYWALLSNEGLLEEVTQGLQYLLVDEAQDTAEVQWGLVHLIRTQGVHTIIFGQVEQSLYSWRGAVPAEFLSFAKNAPSVPLTINYRSLPTICDVANRIVRKQPWAITGDMTAVAEDPVLAVYCEQYGSIVEEATTAVRAAQSAGELRDHAILARCGVSLDLCEIVCNKLRVPYRKLGGGGSFLTSPEALDLLGYLRVAASRDPDYKHLIRTLNKPFRYISRSHIERCKDDARARGVHMLDMLAQQRGSLKPWIRRAFDEYLSLVTSLSAITIDKKPQAPLRMLRKVLDDTDYLAWMAEDNGEQGAAYTSREEIVAELCNLSKPFGTVYEYLDFIAELSNLIAASRDKKKSDSKEDCLTLATLHAAKGLEWNHVRIVDVTNGRFPHPRNPLQEEELRLLYVGVTRARRSCTVSAAGRPSEYFNLINRLANDAGPSLEDEQ